MKYIVEDLINKLNKLHPEQEIRFTWLGKCKVLPLPYCKCKRNKRGERPPAINGKCIECNYYI